MHASAFQIDFDAADLRQMLLERVEESRVEDQFLFVPHLLLDAAVQASDGTVVRRLMQLHRGVKGFEQRQAAHASHKDETTRPTTSSAPSSTRLR